MAEPVRIGVIGAGGFSVGRMLPNFQKLPDVELTVVANRSRASAEKVAAQFAIPEAANDYRDVIAASNVDAVFIGTPPYAHRDIVLAALDAGKHVLCQTRIANTAAEAREMLTRAQEAAGRGIRTMLAPPAPFYRGRAFIEHLVKTGYLGKLRHVQAFNMNDSFADSTVPLSAGRTDPNVYGPYNALQLGLTYDVMAPWTGHATRVLAQQKAFTPMRPATPDGPMAPMAYPEQVTAIGETTAGVLQTNVINWAARFASSRMELYGEDGTIIYTMKGDVIMGGRKGEADLQQLPIPPEHDGIWRVEEEFVKLVRGEIDSPSFTFADGVKNMEYLEAVHRSATEGRWVELA